MKIAYQQKAMRQWILCKVSKGLMSQARRQAERIATKLDTNRIKSYWAYFRVRQSAYDWTIVHGAAYDDDMRMLLVSLPHAETSSRAITNRPIVLKVGGEAQSC